MRAVVPELLPLVLNRGVCLRGEILVHGGDFVNAKRLRKQPHDCWRDYNGKICGVFAGGITMTAIAAWSALRVRPKPPPQRIYH